MLYDETDEEELEIEAESGELEGELLFDLGSS